MDEKEKESKDVVFYNHSDIKIKQNYNSKTDRKNFDDINKRNKIRDNEIFGDKKTAIDPYTGNILHKDGKAAERKYGSQNRTNHTGDMDHTIPISKISKAVQINPYLDEESIRTIANTSGNLELISSKLNRSKGDNTNIEYVIKNLDKLDTETAKKMIQKDFEARMVVGAIYTKETLKGIAKEAQLGSVSAAKYEAVFSGYQHLNKLFDGEESFGEALGGTLDNVAEAAVIGGTKAVVSKGIEQSTIQVINKYSPEIANKLVSNFLNNNQLMKSIMIMKEIGNIIINYINDDITLDELILSLGETGVAMTSMIIAGGEGLIIGSIIGAAIGTYFSPGVGTKIGAKIGGAVGELIGSLIGYGVGKKVYNALTLYISEANASRRHYEYVAARNAKIRESLEEYRKIIRQHKEVLNIRGQILNECCRAITMDDNDYLFYGALDTIDILTKGEKNNISKEEYISIISDKNKVFEL